MGLLVLIGSLLIFGNSINPEIKTQAFQGELSHYQLRETIRIRENDRTVASFTPEGIQGVGITAQTIHQDLKNWSTTLNLRYYRHADYHLVLYTAGVDYLALRPRIPLQLSVGGEVGIGDLDIYHFGKLGKVRDTYGWEVHSAITSYFVGYDRLWNYFVRPTLRSYQFRFEGKRSITDETINGQGFVITAGLGLRF